jgi:hypothetical protein
MKKTNMPHIIEDELEFRLAAAAESDRVYRDQQGQILVSLLNQIAAEVSAALSEAGIQIPIFFSIPSQGGAMLTFATPLDPTEEEWARVSQIICPIVASKIGATSVRSRTLPCVATGTSMGAADLLVGPTTVSDSDL